jgi:hypothetical protein
VTSWNLGCRQGDQNWRIFANWVIACLEQGCQMVHFQTKKSQFGKILEGFGMENFGIVYGHLEFITAIWYISWPFGNLVAIWYFSPVFVYCVKRNLAYPAMSSLFYNCGGGPDFSATFTVIVIY